MLQTWIPIMLTFNALSHCVEDKPNEYVKPSLSTFSMASVLAISYTSAQGLNYANILHPQAS